MKTKSLFLSLAIATVMSFNSMAQLTYGLKLGLNGSDISIKYKDSDREEDTKILLGFHVGAAVDYELSNALSLQSGLLFSQKGFKVDLEADLAPELSIDGYSKTRLNYLEIPIHIAYKISDFQVYAGPYLAYCLGGKQKWDYELSGGGSTVKSKGDYKIKSFLGKVKEDDLGDDEGAVNALDMGLNVGVGYKTGSILINAGYSLGLGNLTPKVDDDDFNRADHKLKNSVISLSVSYFLGQ